MVYKHIPAEGAADVGLSAVFRSLGRFLKLLSELTAQVEVSALRRSGALGDEGGHVVHEHGPLVDVFDEDDHLLVIAELPGVAAHDVGFEVKEDVLALCAARGDRWYRTEILLPAAVCARTAISSYRNGVLVLKLSKGE